jgi:hypothetical protein
MAIEYCEKWIGIRKQAHKILTREQAELRHRERLPYCALIGGREKPSHIISVAQDWVTVKFLDEILRNYLNYDFKEIKRGKLLLSMATFNDFQDKTPEIIASTYFTFSVNGSLIIEQRDYMTGNTVEKIIDDNSIDLNYEPYPEFGNYTKICVRERVRSPVGWVDAGNPPLQK